MDETLLLGQLAEEFTARVRQGQLPNAEEYAQRHPELADRIRQLFPTLMFLEGMAGGSGVASGGAAFSGHHVEQGAIFGSYRIEREVGRGGMGIVYEAVHVALDKRVALKMLPILGVRDTGQLERFLREAKTAAGLHHTNIVPVFDVGQAGGVPYYAMQFIEGRGLDRVLRELNDSAGDEPLNTTDMATLPHIPSASRGADSLPIAPQATPAPKRIGDTEFFAWVARLGIQAAQGLNYAHERGVIHRDIKPSNLMLDGQDILWITDFGLARRTEDVSVTHTGAIVGTPRYMSPEQAESHRQVIDHRTDIYSLGATLYELLTRRPLFDGQTPQEVMLQILGREPVPPRRLNRAVPRDLETIVLKAMAKRAGDRYATAGELADDLNRWLNFEPVQARRIGPLGRTIRWCRRKPAVAALTLAAAASLLVGTIVSTYFAIQANERATDAQHSADIAQVEKQRADEQARAATIEREAAQDSLYRGLYDQARAIGASTQPGRRWEALALLQRAEKLRTRDRQGVALSAANAAQLPSQADLRSEAISALTTHDIHMVHEVEAASTGFPLSLSADGKFAAGMWLKVDMEGQLKGKPQPPRAGVRLAEIAPGRKAAVHEWQNLDYLSFSQALSPDGKTLAALGLTRTGKDVTGIKIRLWELPEFRESERSLAWPQSDTGRPIRRDAMAVARLAFSPDGRRLVGTMDREIVLWDLTSGEPKRLAGAAHPNDLKTLWAPLRGAFSSDGRRLAVQTGEQTIRIWSLDTDEAPVDVELDMPLQGSMAFSAAEPVLAIYCLSAQGDKSAVILWDYAKGEERARIDTTVPAGVAAMSLAFDRQGKRLAVSERSGISIYELPQKKAVLQLPAHQFGVAQLAWTADGRYLISVGMEGVLKLWELSPLTPRSTLPIGDEPAQQFAFSPDGKWIAVSAAGGAARLINRDTLAVERTLTARGNTLFRADSQQLLGLPMIAPKDLAVNFSMSAGGQKTGIKPAGPIILEETLTGRELARQTLDGLPMSSAFTPEGRSLAATWDPTGATTGIWDVATGQAVWKPPAEASKGILYLDPDGQRVAMITPEFFRNMPISLWDLSSGRRIGELDQQGFAPFVTFSPDGHWAATPSINPLRLLSGFTSQSAPADEEKTGDAAQMTVTLWSLPSGEKRLAMLCPGSFRSLSFSPDSRLLAMTSLEGGVQVWSTERGEELFRLRPLGSIQHINFTPDGRSLAWCVESQPQIELLDLRAVRRELSELHLDW